jgi:hypothetical protein
LSFLRFVSVNVESIAPNGSKHIIRELVREAEPPVVTLNALRLSGELDIGEPFGGRNRAMAFGAQKVSRPRRPELDLASWPDIEFVIGVFETSDPVVKLPRPWNVQLMTFAALVHVRRFDRILAVTLETGCVTGFDHHLRCARERPLAAAMAVGAFWFLIRAELSP